MSAWVGAGLVMLVVGLLTSPWLILLGACIIGSTPVWFTLRMMLAAPRRPAKKRYDALGDDIVRLIERIPPGPPTKRDEHKR